MRQAECSWLWATMKPCSRTDSSHVASLNTTPVLTFPPLPLEIHMAPFAVIDLLVAGLQLCFSRAHIDQQVQIPVQKLHGEVIGLQLPAGLLLFGTLRAAVAEQQEAAGLRGAEVERYGACLLCVPPGQCQVGRWRVEGDRLQGFHILAAEY